VSVVGLVSGATEVNTSIYPNSAGSASIGTTAKEFGNVYLNDAAVIYGGADQDVNLTHVPDTGWTTNLNLTAATLTASGAGSFGTFAGAGFLDEDNMVSNAADKAASQQSIKKYVDDNAGGVTLKDIVTTSPLTGGENDALPGADADLTLAVTVAKDIVATSPVTVNGGASLDNVIIGTDADITIAVGDAGAAAKGVVELATTAETTTGTDAGRAVTPDGLEDGFNGSTNITTLGTIATGVWNGTAITAANVNADVATQAELDNVAPTNITPVDASNEDATFYVIIVDGATESQVIETDPGITYNPNSNTLTITSTLSVGGDTVNNQTAADARYLLESNNLSDLENAGTARTNLGLVIGTNVESATSNDFDPDRLAGDTVDDNKIDPDILNITSIDIGLTSAQILVGNAGNQAAGVAMSGHGTMSNAGALTVVDFALTGAGDLGDQNLTSGADVGCDSVSPDAALLTVGDSDEETVTQADGLPDADDTYSCGMVVWLTAGNAVKQFDLVMMMSDGKVDMANASGVPIGFAVEESNDGWPAADTESIGVCLIGSGGTIRNDGWTSHTAGEIVYTVDAGGTDGLFDPADEIDLEDGDFWTAVGVMQEEDIIIFPVPAWVTDDGS